jgi:putative glutamine amidotransferase
VRNPIIGITPTPSNDTFGHGAFYRFCLSDTYVRSVRQAGGVPVILPASRDDPAEALDALDGLILSGGGDIDPTLFTGDPRHRATGLVDELRDISEIELMKAALQRDLPALAICRGIQVMNVAFGGTLHQHVPDNVPNAIQHRQHNDGYSQHDVSHRVEFESTPNPFTQLLGVDEMMVNSFHHQAVADPAPSLAVAGRSSDGVIEAMYHPGMSFGLGVQWHPEMLAKNFPQHAALFTALVTAARHPAVVK